MASQGMKIVVVGLGSMGKRRIRLMQQLDGALEIFGVDFNEERRVQAEKDFSIRTSADLLGVLKKESIDCGFVCTSPLTHTEIIMTLLQNNAHVFTELNLVANHYKQMQELANEKHRTLFLSSTLLYRDDVAAIRERVYGEKVNYIYHTGQYLPDWHPWEDFRNFFVGDKRTNGCREIFAIDLPWMIKTFGAIKRFARWGGRMSNLPLDYSDSYLLLLEHEHGSSGLLAVDVISRVARRSLEIYSEDMHLFWEGSPESLREYDIDGKAIKQISTYENIERQNGYSANIIENAYLKEIQTFFKQVQGDLAAVPYTLTDDLTTLRIIDDIESNIAGEYSV